MPKSTTEVATLPLKPGSEIGNPDNQAAAVLKDCCDTIAQQDGFQQMQIGTQVENPGLMQMMIDWDSKAHHETFMNSDIYSAFLKRFATIMDADPIIAHADFQPDGGLNSALGAPVTEVATFYFDGAPPDDAQENAKKFIETCQKEAPGSGVSGWAYGITDEEIEKDGAKGKGGVLLVGWPSVDAHMEFRNSEVFKNNIDLLRKEVKGIEVHHVAFMNVVAGQ
ncbi:hypothetical protein LTR37_003678 [Vermiconidia calcicola]|uniref:Uncharacterized protein n=1 Tax=Vermiconidia calcicola TaxID=1690605 RepID=A0ACC3NPP1_9PEZI|nr:hypothetical protein LTR37_003678 [Vermiconidia calcicola]